MELRHLRYAVAVGEEGHITRAAERLGIQQPPLSQQIRALEKMIGVTLFKRLPRDMEPTAAGQVFIEKARLILRDVDLASEATRKTARGEAGRLNLGFTSSAAFHPLVTAAVQTLRGRVPDLSLILEEAPSNVLFERVQSGVVDAGFVRLPLDRESGLSCRHLVDEPMAVAMPSDHPLAASGNEEELMSLTTLRNESFVLYHRPSAPGLYDAIIAACAQAGFSPRVEQQASQILSTLSLVAGGLGLSIVPASLARLGPNGVTYRLLDGKVRLVAPLWLIWRQGETSGVMAQLLAAIPSINDGLATKARL